MAEKVCVQSMQNLEVDVRVQGDDCSAVTDGAPMSHVCKDGSRTRNWQIDRKTLTDCMLEVYKNNMWTDMIIYCGTNQEQSLKAHKIILAARSPVFEAMLFGPCSEQKTEYTFPDTNIKTFDNLLRFLYHDDVEFSDIEEAIDLIQTAHMYQITSLVDYCDNYLQTQVTPDNSCKILDVAMKYDKTDLRDACCRFIDRNADAVLESDEFLNVSPAGLMYILKGDTFWAREDVIFHRVEDWARRRLTETGQEENGQNIRDTLGDILYHVRLPTLPMEDINRCIRRKGYFTFSEFEDIIDCNLGNQSHLSFISNNPRINPDSRMDIIGDEYFGEQKHSNISQTLLVQVSRTVHLISIGVPHFDFFLQYGTRLYTSCYNRNANPREGQTLPGSLRVSLDVTIKIDQLNFKESFLREQKSDVSVLVLTKPLLLEKQNSPYKLDIVIKPVDDIDTIKLAGKHGTIGKTFSLWGNKKCISVSQDEESMLGIEWIGFMNCSRRENDDNTTDWSELVDNSEINTDDSERNTDDSESDADDSD